EHAVSEVGEDDRGGLLEQDFLPPLLEARQKEARARGDRADTASWAQHLDAALDERRVHVILCSWVGLLEVFLGARAAGTEGRVHQHRVELLLGQGQQPYAVRYVLSEEPLPRTRCARLLAHKAIECGTDALFGGGEELALLLRGRLHEPLEAQQEPELTREAQRLDQRHEHPPELGI